MYELFENAPKKGKSPTIWAFPQVIDFLKVSGQPVQGPWPPHQQPRPDPDDVESGPIAVPDPQSRFVPKHSTEPGVGAPTPDLGPEADSESSSAEGQ